MAFPRSWIFVLVGLYVLSAYDVLCSTWSALTDEHPRYVSRMYLEEGNSGEDSQNYS